ncbi:MAG: hypothetical protein ACKJSK_20190, partial [Roseibacillus sp.]
RPGEVSSTRVISMAGPPPSGPSVFASLCRDELTFDFPAFDSPQSWRVTLSRRLLMPKGQIAFEFIPTDNAAFFRIEVE